MHKKVLHAQTIKSEGIRSLAIWRSGYLLLWIIVTWLLLAEIVARTPLGNVLPPPSVGADSFEFDVKVYYLEQSIRQRGSLDCLIVGDSMVNDGPDPRLIEEAYHAATGYPIQCFNFGMPALMLDASGPLANALVNRFHPRLLILILSGRDFNSSFGATFRHVAFSDWTQQNTGKTSLRGWAVNSLYGYRYSLLIQYWLNPSNRQKLAETRRAITPLGFTPLYGYGEQNIVEGPGPMFQTNDPKALDGFNQLLQLKQEGVNLLVIDAPIKPDFYSAFRDNYFQPYSEYMQSRLDEHAIPFWQTVDLSNDIASEGWYDLQHLNEIGVPAMSNWMGQQLAEHYPPEFFK